MDQDRNVRQIVNPPGSEFTYDTYHFAQANRVGDLIWVSGQVGVDADMAPAAGMAAQARLAFQSLGDVLKAAGAELRDVVELTTFHIDLHSEMEAFMAVKDEFFPDRFPAWTAVGTPQLALPGLLVEVRATAVAGSGQT